MFPWVSRVRARKASQSMQLSWEYMLPDSLGLGGTLMVQTCWAMVSSNGVVQSLIMSSSSWLGSIQRRARALLSSSSCWYRAMSSSHAGEPCRTMLSSPKKVSGLTGVMNPYWNMYMKSVSL